MSSTLRVSVNALRRISERDRDDSTTPKAVQCKICIEKSSSPLAVITFRPTPIEYDRRGEFYWEPANGDCKNTVDLKVQDNDRFLTFSITHLHGRKSATRVLRLPLSDLAPTEEFSFDYPSNDMCWYPLQPNTSRRFTTALGRILKRQQYAAEGPQPEEVCLKIGWLRLSDTNRATHTQLHTSRSKEETKNQLDATETADEFSGDSDGFFDYLTLKRQRGPWMAEATPRVEIDKNDAKGTPINQTTPPAKRRDAIGLLEIVLKNAINLPRFKSLIPGRYDMDPFAVISLGDKSFKTRFIYHSRNPVWNEHIYFNIDEINIEYPVTVSIYDHDRLKHNDHVVRLSVNVRDLIELSNNQSEVNHLITEKSFEILGTDGTAICLGVNFKNYKKLRMKFWLDLFEEFDFDKNGMINFTEFNAVLQHCGSGLTDEEIVKIFLRDLLGVGINKEDVGTSINKEEVPLQALLDFMEAKTGRSQNFLDIKQCGRCHAKFETGKGTLAFDRDIITHLALCYGIASARKVEDFLLGGFLTESYAQRKWFSRLATRITFGKYEVGKNNGNILIKDRRTGQIIEEKMPVYIRMGIRLLYQSIAGKEAAESNPVKRLLYDLSVRQGQKFDNPKSRSQIIPFIKFHGLDCTEIRWKQPPPTPILSDYSNLSQRLIDCNFENFNEFFYRRLVDGARPVDSPADDCLISSPADCRVNLFENVDQATKLWIKGEKFAVSDLLQDAELNERLINAVVGVFRLAPQDYHRFHHPVDATVEQTKTIQGTYYTVNPMAIREPHLCVFTENVRKVTQMHNRNLGSFAYVCIGAMMVGSIVMTDEKGQQVRRGDEHGYFAFGGSTIILLFPKGSVSWSEDLLENSRNQIETLIRMGETIGRINPLANSTDAAR